MGRIVGHEAGGRLLAGSGIRDAIRQITYVRLRAGTSVLVVLVLLLLLNLSGGRMLLMVLLQLLE